MKITLSDRTEATVRTYFARSREPAIAATLPSSADTVERALEMFEASKLPGATSFGKTILADGRYVGDIWLYCIEAGGDPEAMLSFCVFERELWNRGVATEALRQLLRLAREKLRLERIGAFAFADNLASLAVMRKNGFEERERFTEDGRESVYLERVEPLGRLIDVEIDRPLGSVHPQHPELVYPVNYGFARGIFAPDGEEQDVYLLGFDEPVKSASVRVIAVIHRRNDREDKWVAAPEGVLFTADEIARAVAFQERYFDSEIKLN